MDGTMPSHEHNTISPPLASPRPPLPSSRRCRAVWDYVALYPDELSFLAGDIITVEREVTADWWMGRLPTGQTGLLPATYVVLLSAQSLPLPDPVRRKPSPQELAFSRSQVSEASLPGASTSWRIAAPLTTSTPLRGIRNEAPLFRAEFPPAVASGRLDMSPAPVVLVRCP